MAALRRGLLLLLAAYASICLGMFFGQRDLLYYPRPPIADPPGQSFTLESEGLTLQGRLLNPGRQQALLYFGGNAEQIERRAATLEGLLPEHSIYLLPYRGYGGNPGQPSEDALLRDALAAFDHAARQHAGVSLIGVSLGSGVAVHVAAQRPVRRLVLVMPYDSIENVARTHYPWLPVGWLLRDKFESWRRAPAVKAPSLVLVAAEDRIIPPERSRALAEALPAPVELVEFPGADHDTLGQRTDFWRRVGSFLQAP